MYNKKYLGLLAVLIAMGMIVLFTLLWGCSNDKSVGFRNGDLNDPEFVAIKANLETMVDSSVAGAFNPLTNRWGFPLDSSTWQDKDGWEWWLGFLNPDDSVDYHYTDGWHIIYMTVLSASGSEIFYDSLAFYVNTSPWYMFTDEVDAVKSRGSYEIATESDENVDTVRVINRLDFSHVNTTTSNVTGIINILLNSRYSQGGTEIHEVFDFNVAVNNMAYTRETTENWSTFTSAQGSFSMELNYSVQSGAETPSEQTWIISVSVNGSTARISALRNNTRWIYDYVLGS